jgi:hypothetical protein
MRRRFALRLAPAALVVGLIAAPAGPGLAATQPAVSAQPGPSAALALAERLLAPPGPPGYAPKATLLPGALPDVDAIEALPIPRGATLVGSLARDGNAKMGPGTSYEVVLDAPGGATELLGFYKRELAARGWDTQHDGSGYPATGFQPTLQSAHALFCKASSGPWLNLSVWPRQGAPADVRLYVETASPGPCGMAGRGGPGGMPSEMAAMPALYPPDGAVLQMGGPGRWTSEAVAETALGVADLEAHFARQLEAAGWSRQAGAAAAGAPVAWSTWRKDDWRGVLYAAEGAADRKQLRFEIESTAGGGPGFPMPMRPAVAPAIPVAPPPEAISARRDPASVPPPSAPPASEPAVLVTP